ncbi:ABC transporter permease [Gallibacterium genomosp. 1]|uniref:ABC transporter permease n=1 Tax=Gallibacterium genomosp. 1 TaxID=155515 RepID=UPI0008025B69|nr:ABC transporter permease [Gallibacterium genomosp. 1]OBX03010.1 membrane protein [Gallibacterium genomosp. 1]
MIFNGRIWALIIKELLALFRDPRSRLVLIGPPLLQLFLFSYSATLEVKNISVAVYNQDHGVYSTEVIQRIVASPTFTELQYVQSEQQLQQRLANKKVLMAMQFPADFSQKLLSGKTANIQLLLDGRNSNSAQIIHNYVAQIILQYNTELALQQGKQGLPVVVLTRNWFNENLQHLWYTVPALVGILAGLVALMVTALSVARERELGTFDQILVSPLTPAEILLGKTIPAVMVGLAEGLIIFVLVLTVFKVPFVGSFWLLFAAIFVFILAMVGVGLFISAISKTQQQAILGTFIFLVPAVALSGYASPVENMPNWLQWVVEINPIKHFLIIVNGLFLKDMSAALVWLNLYPMLIIAACTLAVASWLFSQRLE